MATKKVSTVVLAKCEEDVETWNENVAVIHGNGSELQKIKAELEIRSYINQNKSVSRHFLPPLPNSHIPLYVDFGTLKVLSLQELNQRLDERVVSMAPAFMANLTQRFGAYIGRIGQPNLDPMRFRPLQPIA